MTETNGYILDEFDSPIDGKPCVAILTLNSGNRKTSNMCQVWILRRDISPLDAIKANDDVSICGDCVHRIKRTCYVNVGQAPMAVWRAYKARKYTKCDANFDWSDFSHILKGRHIRWGSYGDPAIIKPSIFNDVNRYAEGHTGYTHQWKKYFAESYRGIFMASIDNPSQHTEAKEKGWKCFHVVPLENNGIGKQCPATVENSMAQCITCRLCDGMKQDVWVEAHGRSAARV